ncbi:Cof-type HAD-IIB family hydrolase [Ornithinibacillus scapharcae]|uniref:Cof-type HAD-IIB family hydrolase n=1 Tax=Ornithinibacillus scapharcae TaxID=1147159 RepID=UPI000225AA8C|nr:Cof-type HAD-IIB family hydrolase [Ornithinibacillus scapharcae]
MTYKILFLDIDGTILRPDHTYHPKTKEAIKQAQAQGIQVFLATGRPIHELGDLADDLQINSFIGYNGALAIYRGETIVDEPMKKEIITEYLEIIKKHDHDIVLYTSEDNYVQDIESSRIKDFQEMFQLLTLNPIHEELTNYVLGATVLNIRPDEVPLYEINDDIHLSQVNVSGAEDCYDVIRKSVNKGEAVKAILAHLGIDKEHAVAFGDGMNDKEMLQTVGASFAMGNANPELLSYAKYQTKSVSEAGVYYGLKDLGLVK